MSKVITTLLLAFLSTAIWAKEIPKQPDRLVNDYAKALTSSEVNELEQKLVAYDNETSTQISVVILESLDGEDLFDFSQRLAENWGIGGKENDNGILLLISMSDRKIRIHTGYGTEGAIPDAIAKRIIETDIKPEFKAGNYYTGINKATDSMIAALKGEYKAPPKAPKNKLPFGIIPILIIFILIAIFGRRRRYTTYGRSGRHYHGGPWIGGFGGGSSGGFGGGGGGFGGFGGGGFGGGGASGSW